MISVNGGKIFIDHADVLQICGDTPFKKIFPFARWKKGKWEIIASTQNIEAINKYCGITFTTEERKDVDDIDITKFLMENKYNFKREPYRHQLRALVKCGGAEHFAYFMEPGLGKTKVLIDDVMILAEKGKVDSVLVVCPKSVMGVWEQEIKKDAHNSKVSTWPNDPTFGDSVCWYIINPGALVANSANMTKINRLIKKSSNNQEEVLKLMQQLEKVKNARNGFSVSNKFLCASSHSMMVVDESTCIAHFDSRITELCDLLGTRAEYRRILTGDPIANTPIDVYSQLNWLSSSCVQDRSYFAFRNHFCDMGGYKNKQIVGYKNMAEMRRMINEYGFRVRTQDVFDMPKQNWEVRIVEPTQKTLDLYREVVEKEVLSLFEDKITVSAHLVLTKLIKLQQICGGTIIDDEKQTHHFGMEKLNELKALLEEWNQKGIIIWYHFRGEGTAIYNALKGKYRTSHFNGDLSAAERTEMIRQFEAGDIDVMIIQDDSGHMGITLNRATYAIFYSNHQRPMVRNQAERRNWRIGQTSPVFYYDLLFKGLNDSWLYKRLKERREFNALITDDVTWNKQQVMEAIYDFEV